MKFQKSQTIPNRLPRPANVKVEPTLLEIKKEMLESIGGSDLNTNDLFVLVKNFRKLDKDRQAEVFARIQQSDNDELKSELKKIFKWKLIKSNSG